MMSAPKTRTSMALKFKFKTREEIPAEQVSLYAERDGVWPGYRGCGRVNGSPMWVFGEMYKVQKLHVLALQSPGNGYM